MRSDTADKILERLKRGGCVSGEEMARQLGISRAAVWKAVRSLRARGFAVSGEGSRGYALEACRPPRAANIRAVTRVKAPLFLFDSVPSTNDVALKLLQEGCPHLTCVAANRQSAGRGRLERKFYSPPGTGVYMSVALRGIKSFCDLLVVTPAAAVAAKRAIEERFAVQTQIKWVNDLYLQGKKVCGILTQSLTEKDGSIRGAVVGIGINVSGQMPPELQEKARSLKPDGASEKQRDALIGAVLTHLEEVCRELSSRKFMDEYRACSCVLGRQVGFERGGMEYRGTAESIDDDGALYVRAGAELIKINSGEISLSFPAGQGG